MPDQEVVRSLAYELQQQLKSWLAEVRSQWSTCTIEQKVIYPPRPIWSIWKWWQRPEPYISMRVSYPAKLEYAEELEDKIRYKLKKFRQERETRNLIPVEIELQAFDTLASHNAPESNSPEGEPGHEPEHAAQ